MKVYYDDEADVFYLKLGDEPPEGVIEITEGVNSQRAARLRGRGIKPRPWQGDTPLTPGIRFPAYKAGLITLVRVGEGGNPCSLPELGLLLLRNSLVTGFIGPGRMERKLTRRPTLK